MNVSVLQVPEGWVGEYYVLQVPEGWVGGYYVLQVPEGGTTGTQLEPKIVPQPFE